MGEGSAKITCAWFAYGSWQCSRTKPTEQEGISTCRNNNNQGWFGMWKFKYTYICQSIYVFLLFNKIDMKFSPQDCRESVASLNSNRHIQLQGGHVQWSPDDYLCIYTALPWYYLCLQAEMSLFLVPTLHWCQNIEGRHEFQVCKSYLVILNYLCIVETRNIQKSNCNMNWKIKDPCREKVQVFKLATSLKIYE